MLTIEYITDVVCNEFGCVKNDVINPGKYRKNVIPRRFIHFFCSKFTKETQKVIGEKVGKCHFITVHENIKNFDISDLNFDLKSKYDKINNHLKSINNGKNTLEKTDKS